MDLGGITIPNKNNPNNYMFDTSAYNRIEKNIDCDLPLLEKSLELGYRYYLTDLQAEELAGIRFSRSGAIDNKDLNVTRKIDNFMLIKSKLSIKRTLQQMTFYPNRAKLDGSMFIPMEDTDEIKLYMSILGDNYKHYEDANISTSAMVCNCILVTTDKRMYKKTVKMFPARVLEYGEFIIKIQEKLS